MQLATNVLINSSLIMQQENNELHRDRKGRRRATSVCQCHNMKENKK
jgi:hypothetical protein